MIYKSNVVFLTCIWKTQLKECLEAFCRQNTGWHRPCSTKVAFSLQVQPFYWQEATLQPFFQALKTVLQNGVEFFQSSSNSVVCLSARFESVYWVSTVLTTFGHFFHFAFLTNQKTKIAKKLSKYHQKLKKCKQSLTFHEFFIKNQRQIGNSKFIVNRLKIRSVCYDLDRKTNLQVLKKEKFYIKENQSKWQKTIPLVFAAF